MKADKKQKIMGVFIQEECETLDCLHCQSTGKRCTLVGLMDW